MTMMYLRYNSAFVIEGVPNFNNNQIIPLHAVANEGAYNYIKIDAFGKHSESTRNLFTRQFKCRLS
jgi:hypothetical protein